MLIYHISLYGKFEASTTLKSFQFAISRQYVGCDHDQENTFRRSRKRIFTKSTLQKQQAQIITKHDQKRLRRSNPRHLRSRRKRGQESSRGETSLEQSTTDQTSRTTQIF